MGVGTGDFVAVMLPNGADFAALIFAIILRRTGARVVVAETFGSNTPHTLVEGLRDGLPSLEPVPRRLHLGMTGEPKGVLNTHQTLQVVLDNWAGHLGSDSLGDPLVNLVASPVGHHTGFLWGVLLTTYLRGTAVYLDRWVPDQGAQVIREEGITTMFSAPTFLQDLLLTDLVRDGDCSLWTVILAGAPVPRSLPTVAGEMFGCYVCPAWGMTELGIGISRAPHLPAEAQATDGMPVPGTEVSIVGPDGQEVPPGVVGELRIPPVGLLLGYLHLPEATAEAINAEGWFTTGDAARRIVEGYIALEGRTKDIVIRGGENTPVTVVESLLFQHPDIVEASWASPTSASVNGPARSWRRGAA